MAVSVNVNNLSLVHKASMGITMATIPDVCKTPSPGGPVPIPYPNISRSGSLDKGSKKVKADGGNMIAVKGSEFSVSNGDEAGTVGGVKSSTFMKEAKWLTYSFDVKIEGKNASRLTDKMTCNHGNTVSLGGEQQPRVAKGKAFDCKAEWGKLQQETKKISEIEDPIERNKQISAAYAETYQNNPDLQWSGAAAFASKQVGCGLQSAKKQMDSWFDFKKDYAKTFYEGLGKGNKAVFEEIHPVMQFYSKNGIEGLRQCASSRKPPVPKKLLEGIEDVDQGDIESGAEKMLMYEQSVTLQNEVYNNKAFEKAVKLNQMGAKLKVGKMFGAEDIKVTFSAECDGEPAVFFKGSNLADLDQRWPYAKKVANKFQSLAQQDKSLIDEQLKAIASRGN